jgi:hypothetical protein
MLILYCRSRIFQSPWCTGRVQIYAGMQIDTALSHFSMTLSSLSKDPSAAGSTLQIAQKEVFWFVASFENIYNTARFLGLKSHAFAQCIMILKLVPVQRSLPDQYLSSALWEERQCKKEEAYALIKELEPTRVDLCRTNLEELAL